MNNSIILNPQQWQGAFGAGEADLFTEDGVNRFWATVAYLLDDRVVRTLVNEVECMVVEIPLKGNYVLRVEAKQTRLESTLFQTNSQEKLPSHIASLVEGLNGRMKHDKFWSTVSFMLNGRWVDGDSRLISIALNSQAALNLIFDDGKIRCEFGDVAKASLCFDAELNRKVREVINEMFSPSLNPFQVRTLMRKHLPTDALAEFHIHGELDASLLFAGVSADFLGGKTIYEFDIDFEKVHVEWRGLEA